MEKFSFIQKQKDHKNDKKKSKISTFEKSYIINYPNYEGFRWS